MPIKKSNHVWLCVCVLVAAYQTAFWVQDSLDWGEGGDSLCSSNRYRNRNRNWAAAARSVCPRASWQAIPRRPKTKTKTKTLTAALTPSQTRSVSLLAGGLLQVDPSRFFCIVSSALCAAFGFSWPPAPTNRTETHPKPSSEPSNKLQLKTLTKTIAICILYSNYLCNLPHCAP